MRIVLFGNSTWCLSNFRRGLIAALVGRGLDVHVLAPFDPSFDNETHVRELEALGAKFHRIDLRPRNLNPLRELLVIASLCRFYRSLRPSFVLSFTVKCNLYTGICRRFVKFEQIANIPGLGEAFERKNLLRFVVSTLYRSSLRKVRAALFQNVDDLRYCVQQGLVQSDRCALIPGSGVDLARFEARPVPVTAGKRVFMMFGRLLPLKGYYEFLEAARRVREIVGDRAEFRVMGIRDKNRAESSEVEAAIDEAAESGLITKIAPRSDVRPVLTETDVVVLPSRYNEGIPRSLLEAMASGKVLIATDWKGCRDTVVHGDNGYLVSASGSSSEIVDSLTEAMLRLCDLSDEQLSKMGRTSRKLVEGNYDERRVLDAYLRRVTGEGIVDLGETGEEGWDEDQAAIFA